MAILRAIRVTRQRIAEAEAPRVCTPVQRDGTPEPPRRQRAARGPVESYQPGMFREAVKRQVGRAQEERIGTEYVHMTSLADFCARQHFLASEDHVQPMKPMTVGHAVMWELGRAAEKLVRSKIIADRNYEGIWGRWTCVCEYEFFEGFFPANAGPCPRCTRPRNEYKEWTFFDPDAEVSGNPDLLVFLGGRVLVIEIKSMNGDEFDALEAPVPNHIFQATGYHRLAQREGMPVTPEVVVIYVTKKFKWGDPLKEFGVSVTAQHGAVLDLAMSDATGLAVAKATGVCPARICTSSSQTRAKQCGVMGQCWSRRA